MTNQSYPRMSLIDMKHASLNKSVNIDHMLILSIIIAAAQVMHQIDVSGVYDFDEKYVLDLHDTDPTKVNITIYEKEKENGWIDDGWKELGHLFIPLDENGIIQMNAFDPHSMKQILPEGTPSIDDTIGPDAFWAISHNDIVLNMFTMIYYIIDIRAKTILDDYKVHKDLSDFAKQLAEQADIKHHIDRAINRIPRESEKDIKPSRPLVVGATRGAAIQMADFVNDVEEQQRENKDE